MKPDFSAWAEAFFETGEALVRGDELTERQDQLRPLWEVFASLAGTRLPDGNLRILIRGSELVLPPFTMAQALTMIVTEGHEPVQFFASGAHVKALEKVNRVPVHRIESSEPRDVRTMTTEELHAELRTIRAARQRIVDKPKTEKSRPKDALSAATAGMSPQEIADALAQVLAARS